MEVDSRAPSEAGEPPSVGKPADDEEDQLLSDNESTAGGVPASEAGSTASRALDSRAAGLEKLRETAREKTKGITARFTIEDKIKSNSDKDDFVEREFRRYQGVARIRPLGKDRFHNRYWWFDGIGSMDLVASDPSSSSTTAPCANGSDVGYGTGRLFVQGPSEEDWEMVADLKGAGGEEGRQMRERRVVEEVVESEEGLLGVDEWAFYEDEDEVRFSSSSPPLLHHFQGKEANASSLIDAQIEALLAWLNSKGTRELALKTAIQKWRPFIMAGAEARRFVRLPSLPCHPSYSILMTKTTIRTPPTRTSSAPTLLPPRFRQTVAVLAASRLSRSCSTRTWGGGTRGRGTEGAARWAGEVIGRCCSSLFFSPLSSFSFPLFSSSISTFHSLPHEETPTTTK